MHEYNIVNFMGLVVTDHQELINDIDYIIVDKKNDKMPDGYYFDVSKILEVRNTKFGE